MSSEAVGRGRSWTPAILLAALIVLALALRVLRLGYWGFEGDEIFTLRDSIGPPRLGNPRPLMYFLNYYLVRPFAPLDELGLRLLPALFGVLAIPVFYAIARRLVGSRAALFGALLLAVNGLHVYQSQNARYWSLVFLLSAVYPFALYLGFRDRNIPALALGAVTSILALLAHPVAALLLPGVALALVVTHVRREHLVQLWNRRSFRWGAVVTGIIFGAIAVRYIPILHAWIVAHDVTRVPDHLLFLPRTPGVKQIAMLLSYVDGLTPGVVLTGAAGAYLLWRRDRPLATLVICLLVVPMGILLLLSFRTAVSTSYFLPSAPGFFLGAGVLLDRLARMDWEPRKSWLLSALVATLIIIGGAPTLISQYRDGRRHDFRGVAYWLQDRLGPGDIVYSEQSSTMNHYLGGRSVHRLYADPAPLIQSRKELGPGKVMWVVVPASLKGSFRTNARLGDLKGWIYDHCQLRNSVGVARLDHRQKELQIFRCPVESRPALDTVASPAGHR